MKIAAVVLLFALSTGAYADGISETLTLNTSALPSSGSPYNLELQLTGNSGNTVTFGNFDFGGGMGTFSTSPQPGVTVTTSPATVVQMDATGATGNFGPEYDLPFIPGTKLSFSVMSSNIGPQTGAVPDEIIVSLADNSGMALTTTDPAFNNSLYTLLLTGNADTPALYSGVGPVFTGQFVATPGPSIGGGGGSTGGGGGNPGGGGTTGTSPEPSTLVMALSGLLGCVFLMRRRVGQGKS